MMHNVSHENLNFWDAWAWVKKNTKGSKQFRKIGMKLKKESNEEKINDKIFINVSYKVINWRIRIKISISKDLNIHSKKFLHLERVSNLQKKKE